MKFIVWVLPLLLVGCASVYEYGDGHVAIVRSAEERSPFGTNMGFAKLQKCEKVETSTHPLLYDYVHCYDLTDWTPMSSQGQGGQIVSGALTGIGLGVAGALVDSGTASASSTVSTVQSVTLQGAKGHHE